MSQQRVCVIGSGISGIAAAKVLKKCGFDVVVYEKTNSIGGVWSISYPEVRLQNIASQYYFTDFPWPFQCDRHPTGSQIMEYLEQAVKHFGLDVRLDSAVSKMEEMEDGWKVYIDTASGIKIERFSFVIVATGQYTDRKNRPHFPGEDTFRGSIVTERDVTTLDIFNGKRTVVVGFGKTALDLATFSSSRTEQTIHLFRTPRWTIPDYIFGVDWTIPLFSRFCTMMITCWDHPSPLERVLHSLAFLINFFWSVIAIIFHYQVRLIGHGMGYMANARINIATPTHHFLQDLRSAIALLPDDYYPQVAKGRIIPCQAELSGFTSDGIILKGGEIIPCDQVVLALGNLTARFPFLPASYRWMMERDDHTGGTQLYRHLIHPRIPRVGFAGFNHGFLHIPGVEVGTLWLVALFTGDIELPTVEVN